MFFIMSSLCVRSSSNSPLYQVHLISETLTQESYQPIKWQQLDKFRHLYTIVATKENQLITNDGWLLDFLRSTLKK